MKKIILSFFICILFISGCATKDGSISMNNNKKDEVQQLKERIKVLESQLKEKNTYIKKIKKQEQLFPILSNKALTFVRGQTQGDIEKLKEVISDNISIVVEEDIIYGIYEDYGEEIKYPLYDKSRKTKYRYKDMVIQGYGYLEDDTYGIHIQKFFVNENDKSISPTFLDLYFTEIDGKWKVDKFEFDI